MSTGEKPIGPKPGQDLGRLTSLIGSIRPTFERRRRLRQCLIRAGAENLPDYELLQVMLFTSNPHADVESLVREVIKRALELGASALILVHNHPSGDPSPSAADITVTQDIIKAAASLQILVHDHLIIGRGGHVSLRDRGLILSEVKDAGSSTSASSR